MREALEWMVGTKAVKGIIVRNTEEKKRRGSLDSVLECFSPTSL